MKKLHLLVLRSYIGPLLLTFCIALFVLLMQFLWKYIDDLVGKGLDFWIVGQLLFYASATFVPMALPLAILLASLMTFGNLGEHYELVAAKASGISFRKIMMPLVILSLLISGLGFYFSNQVLPVANLKMWSLLYDVKDQKPALNIREGIFYHDIDNYVIKVGEKDKDGQTIRRVLVYDHTNAGGNTTLTVAQEGKMETTEDKRTLIFTLRNGTNYHEPRDNSKSLTRRPMQRIHFDEEVLRFDLSSFSMSRTSEDLFKEHYQMMNLKQLYTSIDTLKHNRSFRQGMFADQFKKSLSYYYNFYILKKRPPITHMEFKSKSFDELNKDLDAAQNRMAMSEAIGKARANSMMIDNYSKEIGTKDKVLIKHWVEIHRKFTLSIACLLLFFIGAPLGAIIRKGGLGMPLVVSVIVFILYYIISITGEKFVKEGAIVPEIGMWISSAILLPFGIWLTIKTTADSPLMESDRWVKFTERIGRFFRSKRRKNENPAGLS